MSQEIKTYSPCAHPGGESGEWESMSLVGGTQAEHDASVARAKADGWQAWADGKMETVTGDVPAAYLFRGLK
jgi:hypothetical protein